MHIEVVEWDFKFCYFSCSSYIADELESYALHQTDNFSKSVPCITFFCRSY